jgi:hypothetical protein
MPMRTVAAPNNCREQRAQNRSSDLNEEKSFNAQSRAVIQEPHQNGDRARKNQEEPQKIEQPDKLFVRHVQPDRSGTYWL